MTTTRHYRNRNLKTYRGKTWKILEIWHLQNESWKSGLVLLNKLSRIHSSSLLGSGKLLHHVISTNFFTTHSLFSPELYAGLDPVLSILWQPAKEMGCLKCIPHLAEQLRHLTQCASTVQRVYGRTGWPSHLYFTLLPDPLPGRLSLSFSIKTYKCCLYARKSPIPLHANTLKR